MFISGNMGLTVWDKEEDFFSHASLEGDLVAIDQHDHSPAHGVQVGTAGIRSQAITTDLIAPNAVQTAQLANNAVSTGKIQTAAITSALLAAQAVTTAAIANNAVGFAQMDTTVLPLGTVIMWFKGPSTPIPSGGWEIMDGRPWSTITNSLGFTAGNILDMRGLFVKGADLLGTHGPSIGTTGGSSTANLSHSHTVNGHTHPVPHHHHNIDPDGKHFHTWFGGLPAWSAQNAFPPGLTINDAGSAQRQNLSYTLYINNVSGRTTLTNLSSDMDQTGDHSHGGHTQDSDDIDTASATASTNSSLGSVTIDPPWGALLFIMRCR